MSCKRFEVWIADLNPRFGTEPGKTRPILVVQNDFMNKRFPSTIVCPITTYVRGKTSIIRLNLEQGEAGLNERSAIMIDQIRAIDKKRLLKKIGTLSEKHTTKLEENIKIVLGFNF
ncbi:MAG: type II toxin-antitoxin system PemK/MazF family toxin [Bacteroidota bacterium]